MNKSAYLRAVGCIIGCWIAYLLFSFPSWREPVMGDEVNVVLWAKALKDRSIMEYFIHNGDTLFANWHPPTYVCLIAVLGNFTSFNEVTMRLIGVISFLISLVLIYAITYGLFKEDKRRGSMASLACLIYALSPFAVKGSMLIDLDVILSPAILVLILAFVFYRHDEYSPKKFFLCAALFAAALSIKNSTPLILTASMFTYQLLGREWKKLLCTAKIIAAGLFLALAIRLVYCHMNNMDFFGVYQHMAQIAGYIPLVRYSKNIGWGWLVLARNVLTPIIWYSPSFVIMAFIGFWEIIKIRAEDNALMSRPQFAFYGLVIFVVYIFFGGVTHSFPKYHYASVPILAVLAASTFIKNVKIDRHLLTQMAILFLILVLYNMYFVKDLLYTVNYALKEALIFGNSASVSAIIRNVAARIILLLLTIPAVFLFYMRRNVREAFFIALFVTLLASNASLLFIQRAARYNTVYCYGAKGVRETADFVFLNTDLCDTILAPSEILLLSKRNLPSYTVVKDLNDKEAFLSTLKKTGLKCVVYGISGNTVEQYRGIFCGEDILEFMNKHYIRHEIGSYTVWIRKKQR